VCNLSSNSENYKDIRTYTPHEFNLTDNYNVLKISEIHAEKERGYERSEYVKNIAQQINTYSNEYCVDEIWICGDTGSYNDVEKLLSSLETTANVKLIAGDEDKINAEKHDSRHWDGWMRQITTPEPFNVDVDYEIFDEGFQEEINDSVIEVAHHPNKPKRDNNLTPPDRRDNSFLENLFSIRHDSNQNTAYTDCLISDTPNSTNTTEETFDLLEDDVEKAMERNSKINTDKAYFEALEADILVYDHVHMAYPRTISHENINDKILIGLGGRRNNYGTTEKLPESSLHLASFGEELIHGLHFDAEIDEIFEHVIFEQKENQTQMYRKNVPGTYSETGYLPIQERFNRQDIRNESWENSEELPLWSEK